MAGPNVGKCHHCKQPIAVVNAENVEIRMESEKVSDGLSYSCPHCQTVLSVGYDPYWLRAKLVKALASAVKSAARKG